VPYHKGIKKGTWKWEINGQNSLDDIKDLFFFAVLGFPYYLGLLGKISHPFLEERGPKDITGQVFCGLILTGQNPGSHIDLELWDEDLRK